MNSFHELGIQPELLTAIHELGFIAPTPVQMKAIPALLSSDNDYMALAQTGTGKTAAFGLPLLQRLNFDNRNLQAIILCPTRELCLQITRDFTNFAKHLPKVKLVAVYGGASISSQIKEIKQGVQIIVATPGRFIDLMERKVIRMNEVTRVVLDEADEMLNMGFQEDIDKILSQTPDTKTTWLFSATMPSEVRRIAERYMKSPQTISVGNQNQSAENIEHVYYVVRPRDKYHVLKRIADFYPDIYGLVFCRTKAETQEIAEHLMKDGYNADSLHGDLSQPQREKTMKRFRDKSIQMLVATDVAARGIDVSNITHVINYSLPDEPEVYTHRSGRTARAGKSGIAVSFVTPDKLFFIKKLEKETRSKFKEEKIPTGEQVCEKQLMNIIRNIHTIEVDEQAITPFLPAILEELGDLSQEELIKRFTSLEFNRFLQYYKNAPDLNNAGSRRTREENFSSGKNYVRFFINLGELDGVEKNKFIGWIADTAALPAGVIGKVDLKKSFSFFEVDESAADLVKNLNGITYKGRKLRVNLEEGNRRPEREKSFGRGGDRGSFKGKRGGKGFGKKKFERR